MTPAEALIAEALAMRDLGANVVKATDIGTYAIELGVNNWAAGPLNGKVPAIPGGRGVLDFTTDTDVIAAWWGGRYAGCNIGARVPDSMVVVDIDPRHGGHRSIAELEQRHGRLPETLTTISGRGDGGRHLFFRRPSGKLTSKRLGPGVDLKTSSGYVVMPPSIHPDSGQPYTRIDAPLAAPPAWLVTLLKPEPPVAAPRSPRRHLYALHGGPSIADHFTVKAKWGDILTPHGWHCIDTDPDADGARWLHPNATSSCSATIRHGCLFVYSPNTPFDPTESGDPHGYTKFRAYAVLEHGGDLKAAARALRTGAAQ